MIDCLYSLTSTAPSFNLEAHTKCRLERRKTFTLKTILHTRRNHGLSTHVAFIDLIKAYDTANHNLLIHILCKVWSTVCKLCKVVERLYNDLKVVFKIGKDKLVKQ